MMDILNILKEFYGIAIKDYKPYKEGILFFASGNYYLFTKCYYDEAYIANLYLVCNELRKEKVQLHDFVYNKEKKLISKDYVLLKVNEFIEEITFDDVLFFNSIDCNKFKDHYTFMDKFWEEKIDYLEMQLSELSNNKLLNNSFDYYVGIAEILIDYLRRNYQGGSFDLRLSHKCLNCLDSLEYYNPLNISFDLKYKDIAAYLRKKGDMELILEMIEKATRSDEYRYFFVRMVFPFRYFYELEEILVDGKDNHELINVVNHVDNYEKYLLNIERLFGIFIFDWIKEE